MHFTVGEQEIPRRIYYKANEGEEITYIDVCSLYPCVCKNGKFPVGHPTVILGKDCPEKLDGVDGLIICILLPPQNLYHLFLPDSMNNKLMHSLCRSCARDQNIYEGEHCDSDRSITGIWVIDVVLKALQKGYKILEVQEISKYTVKRYAKFKNVGGIFTGIMNEFLKINQRASG